MNRYIFYPFAVVVGVGVAAITAALTNSTLATIAAVIFVEVLCLYAVVKENDT